MTDGGNFGVRIMTAEEVKVDQGKLVGRKLGTSQRHVKNTVTQATSLVGGVERTAPLWRSPPLIAESREEKKGFQIRRTGPATKWIVDMLSSFSIKVARLHLLGYDQQRRSLKFRWAKSCSAWLEAKYFVVEQGLEVEKRQGLYSPTNWYLVHLLSSVIFCSQSLYYSDHLSKAIETTGERRPGRDSHRAGLRCNRRDNNHAYPRIPSYLARRSIARLVPGHIRQHIERIVSGHSFVHGGTVDSTNSCG